MQKAYEFDKESVKKILRGALHAMVVASMLALLDFTLQVVGAIESNNILTIACQAWFAQTGYQIIRQYIKGKE